MVLRGKAGLGRQPYHHLGLDTSTPQKPTEERHRGGALVLLSPLSNSLFSFFLIRYIWFFSFVLFGVSLVESSHG